CARDPLPAPPRAVRAPRGRTRVPAVVLGQGGTVVRGPRAARLRGTLLPAPAPGTRPDARRRERRTPDASTRGTSCGRVQHHGRGRRCRPQAGRVAIAL